MSSDKKEIELGDTLSHNINVDDQVAEQGYCKAESESSQRQLPRRSQNAPRTGIIVPQYGRDTTSTTRPAAKAEAPQDLPRSGIIVPQYRSNTTATTESAIEADVPSTDVATTMIEQLSMSTHEQNSQSSTSPTNPLDFLSFLIAKQLPRDGHLVETLEARIPEFPSEGLIREPILLHLEEAKAGLARLRNCRRIVDDIINHDHLATPAEMAETEDVWMLLAMMPMDAETEARCEEFARQWNFEAQGLEEE